MLPSRPFITLTLTASFFSPPLFLNRRLFLRLCSKFSPVAKTNNAMSSPAEPSPIRGNSAAHHDPVPLSDSSHDNEAIIMIGSNPVPLYKRAKNTSRDTFSTRCDSSVGKLPELMSRSDHLPSPATSTCSQHRKSKRRTRIDLGLTKDSGDNCSESSCGSSFENTQNSNVSLTRHSDESPQPSQFLKKSASANRPYHIQHNLNCKEAGYDRDSPGSTPKFERYDICFHGKRNSPLIGGSTLFEKNSESSIEMEDGATKEGVLRPGMVLLKHCITHIEQVEIVKRCRKLGLGPGGFYQPCFASGAKLRLRMMCLGMDWDPQTKKYGNKRAFDSSKPPDIPPYFRSLVIRAIQKAQDLIPREHDISNVEDILPSMTPDIGIVNFYTTYGRLGLHQMNGKLVLLQ
ncbi:uncharacterized protein LOC130749164 isoform X2 [Lotus japonicus]|uniref:uncharacterized protein LOC130749164 isoform X2 n=1 Tax=Lotus japonicus TaxID=34305 RepID=UPI00258C620D|nr:uncharacterized protein LOC130749164 isoform X2 [Lotus japonicus]